jgi:hypothetical protein
MRAAATLLLVLLVAPAHAQLYRCVDAKGKVQYSDKPLAGCKPLARQENAPAPPPAAPRPGAKGPAKPAAKVAMTPEQRSQNELRCRGLEQEREFLARRRAEPLPSQEERRSQVEAVIARECR